MKVIGYLSLGYPTLEQSLRMADAYFEGGCDAIEISIPCSDPKYEKETIRKWMQQAYAAESNYEVYFDAVASIKKKHPENELYTMVYQEAIDKAGIERYADFCLQAGVNCVISANLSPETIETFDRKGVTRCSFGSFILDPVRLRGCLGKGGLIYCQTAPFPGQQPLNGYETLGSVIKYMRDLGITRPIYCGGGIKTPEDAKMVKDAGADGFFVGTAIISYADDLEKIKETIRSYREAVA